jgi:hypothetical protein
MRWLASRAWVAVAAAIALPARGFVIDINALGEARRWHLNPPDPRVPATSVNRTTGAIIYRLGGSAFSPTNSLAELDAIRAAFDQWQAIPGTRLNFEEGPLLPGPGRVDSQDGINSVFWATNVFVDGLDQLSGSLALTYVASYSDGNVIADADLVLNGAQFRWFTDYSDPTRQGVFVDAIALHEIGHFLGLRHSPVGGATMLFVGDFGVNSQSGLSMDEWCAARALYGSAASIAEAARVHGTVQRDGAPIFGAAVFAEDEKGNLIAGTVTRSNGAYELAGLVPGIFRLRAAPLDPVIAANHLIRGADIASTYQGAFVSFPPTPDILVTNVPGEPRQVDFQVEQGQPLRIVRLLRPTLDLASPSSNNKPIAVRRGGPPLYVGVLTAEALEGSVELFIPGDGLEIGATEVRNNAVGNLSLAAVPLTVGSDATPGLRSFRLQRGNDVAWASGFLEILPDVTDSNLDGMDDVFQRRYWSRFTTAAAAPDADPDEDGFNNAWEFATGSIPTNRLSAHFEIESVEVTARGARVRSQAAAGKRFQLFSRETLPGSEWMAVGGPVAAMAGTAEFLDPTGTNHVRFYRVQLLP